MTVVDTHVHLDDRRFDADRDQVLQRAWQAGVEFVVNAGADAASSGSGEASPAEARVYAAVGVHPTMPVPTHHRWKPSASFGR